ncbi:MAG: hypothetical protein ACRCVL_04395 [Cetobacterium sp.]
MGLKAAHVAGASEGVICSTESELTVDLKFAIFSLKNLKKLSQRVSEATDKVHTVGLTTEFITENSTFGLE